MLKIVKFNTVDLQVKKDVDSDFLQNRLQTLIAYIEIPILRAKMAGQPCSTGNQKCGLPPRSEAGRVAKIWDRSCTCGFWFSVDPFIKYAGRMGLMGPVHLLDLMQPMGPYGSCKLHH